MTTEQLNARARMEFSWCSVFLVVLLVKPALAMPTTNFDQFFPFWNPMLQEILQRNCTDEYATYKTGDRPDGTPLSSIITPVINCILETLPEYKKAELGASAVILGLLPTILQALGSTPAETALLFLRRPVLSTLLALGSPSVATLRSSEFMTSISDLVENGDTRPTTLNARRWRQIPSAWRFALSVLEYLVTSAAVANILYLAYQLGFHAVVMFAPETIFLLPLWTFICLIIHFGGVLILYLKLHIEHKPRHDESVVSRQLPEPFESVRHHQQAVSQSIEPIPGELRRRGTTASIQQEFTLAAFQEPKRLRWRKETILVNFLIWLLSLGTLINLVFGSMIFSSLLFFSVRDVLLIVARYFISTLVCRGIMRLELSGMKECTFYDPAENAIEMDNQADRKSLGGTSQAFLLKDFRDHDQEIMR